MTWWNFLKCFKITHFRLILRFRITLVLISDHTLLNDAVCSIFNDVPFLKLNKILDQAPGPQNNVMRESKNWHTKWQRKMHDNDRSPYWLSPLLKVRSRACLVYVWENTLRYDVLRVNRTALNHYGDCSGQNVSLSKIFVAANSWIGLEVVF